LGCFQHVFFHAEIKNIFFLKNFFYAQNIYFFFFLKKIKPVKGRMQSDDPVFYLKKPHASAATNMHTNLKKV
jgi:hypothetical protein